MLDRVVVRVFAEVDTHRFDREPESEWALPEMRIQLVHDSCATVTLLIIISSHKTINSRSMYYRKPDILTTIYLITMGGAMDSGLTGAPPPVAVACACSSEEQPSYEESEHAEAAPGDTLPE